MLGPDVQQAGPGLLPGRGQVDGDAAGFQETPGRGSDRGHEEVAGKPAAEGGAPLGGLGLKRLDRGHAADHQPGVGAGAERVEGDVQRVLVAGEFEVDERQQQRLGAGAAQGGDELRRAVRAAGDEHPGAVRGPRAGRRPARRGRRRSGSRSGSSSASRSGTVPSHGLVAAAVQEAARSAMSPAPRASRTSASSIPSRVAPTSVSPSVAFWSRMVAVPSTAHTTASRCSMLPLR